MGRIAFCQACSNIEWGVKSRVGFDHTCGLSAEEIRVKIAEAKHKTFHLRLDPFKVEAK